MQEITKGDIVIVDQGIGIVRYIGEVQFDQDSTYYGIEVKGPSVPGGNNGTYNNKQYFKCRAEHGIFIKYPKIIRMVPSEEVLEKLAEIYDILKCRQRSQIPTNFIDKNTYNLLNEKYIKLNNDYARVCQQCKELELDVDIHCKEISHMKGEYKKKIFETGKLHEKINRAEEKIGSRLSQFNMEDIVRNINTKEVSYEIPDYSKTTDHSKTHTKQRSSMTMEMLEETTDFTQIAQDVRFLGNARASMDFDIPPNPTHYKKYSHTTLDAMNIQRNKESDEESVDTNEMYDEQPHEQSQKTQNSYHRKARDSLTIETIEKKTIRGARSSLIIDDTAIKSAHQARDSVIINEDVSTDDKRRRRRKARDSRIVNDVEIDENVESEDEDEMGGMKGGFGLGNGISHMIKDDPFGNNLAHNLSKRNPEKMREMKARNSISAAEGGGFLSKSFLEAHDENIANGVEVHKKSDTMTSDSSAYKYFNSVD